MASFIKVTSSKSRKLLFVNGTLVNNFVNLLKTLLTKKLSKQLYGLPPCIQPGTQTSTKFNNHSL